MPRPPAHALQVRVRDLVARGTIRATLKSLAGELPVVGAVKLSFVKPPKFDYQVSKLETWGRALVGAGGRAVGGGHCRAVLLSSCLNVTNRLVGKLGHGVRASIRKQAGPGLRAKGSGAAGGRQGQVFGGPW